MLGPGPIREADPIGSARAGNEMRESVDAVRECIEGTGTCCE